MVTTWVRGSTAALAGLGTLLVSTPAWADADATLRTGQAPTTAVAFSAHGCDEDLGGGPYPDDDVWAFVLPDRDREFVTVTAAFDTDGDSIGDTSLSTPISGGIDDGNGTSKAWIVAPAGATLVGASAVVTGAPASQSSSFNIHRTCPAMAAPPPSPPASSGPTSPGASASPRSSAIPIALPGTGPRRDAAGGTNAGSVALGVPPSESATSGPAPDGTPVASTSAGSELMAAPASGGAAGFRRLVLAACAVLASTGCAAVLVLIWRRRTRPDRLRRGGRHHLLPR